MLYMFNDLTSPLRYLKTRRSGRPRDMIAPGPDDSQLDDILRIAARTPDHGKLFPWRFVKISLDARPAFASLLEKAFVDANPSARSMQIDAATAMASMAPSLVVLIHSPKESAKIPDWEQALSTGAVGMNLLHAAHACGFVGGWITGWAAYDDNVRLALCNKNERIAGFFFFGTAGQPLEERPRPDIAKLVSDFSAS
jgi:nitroreductase